MQLSSAAFEDAGPVPRRFTCDGADLSPPLAWAEPPAAARSFVVLCNDPDAPGGIWRHWAVYDINASVRGLDEGFSSGAGDMKQGVNDFGRRGYGGPCPPRGHGAHHYRFILLALDAPSLGLSDGAPCREVERAAHSHALAEAQLSGLYQR